jgi:hypothetical protein
MGHYEGKSQKAIIRAILGVLGAEEDAELPKSRRTPAAAR